MYQDLNLMYKIIENEETYYRIFNLVCVGTGAIFTGKKGIYKSYTFIKFFLHSYIRHYKIL